MELSSLSSEDSNFSSDLGDFATVIATFTGEFEPLWKIADAISDLIGLIN